MAIKLEFYNVIVPVEKIRENLGDDAFQRQLATATETTWHDDYLFREGSMNPYDLDDILDYWEGRGFQLLTIIDGKKYWLDLCVVNSGHGPSFPCEWIEYDSEQNVVWLKGHDPGVAVGPVGRKVAGEDE